MNLSSTKENLCSYWVYDKLTFNYLHTGWCTKPSIEIDYLTKIHTTINIDDMHTINQFQNCLIVIKSGRDEIFYGVITSYGDSYTLICNSLLDYIDFPTFIWHNDEYEPCEMLATILEREYILNTDTQCRLPNLTVTYEPSSHSLKWKDDDSTTYYLQEIREKLFKSYNIILEITFSHNDKSINFHVYKNTTGIRSISTKLHDVVNVTNLDFTMVTNKCAVYNKWTTTDETTEEQTTHIQYVDDYFLLDDGSTTDDPLADGRLTPVIRELVYCEKGEEAQAIADTLQSWEYNEELEFKVLTESKMIEVDTYNIGDPLQIHYGNYVTVKTIISGMYKDGLYTVFKCGLNRNTLENYLRNRR